MLHLLPDIVAVAEHPWQDERAVQGGGKPQRIAQRLAQVRILLVEAAGGLGGSDAVWKSVDRQRGALGRDGEVPPLAKVRA